MKHYAVYYGNSSTPVTNWRTKEKAIYTRFANAKDYADEMNCISSGYYVADYTPKKQRKVKEIK